MQLVGHELIGEAAGEGHQVVGGDGAGDSDTHDGSAPGGEAMMKENNKKSHTTLPVPRISTRSGSGRSVGRST
ncbi:hypothetical protein GCM10018779_47740 [Streptomyces griseocarneus]|nr:hypothetical protein GCM10018779_47740 [Streptomyces griseocarneus]